MNDCHDYQCVSHLPGGAKSTFFPFRLVEQCPFLAPSWALCVIFLSLLIVKPSLFAHKERKTWRCPAGGKIKVQEWVPTLISCSGQRMEKRQDPAVPLFHVQNCEFWNSFALSSTNWAEILWKRCPSPEEWITTASIYALSRSQSLTNTL